MSRTSSADAFPIRGNKREIKKTKEEWERLVTTCLNSRFSGKKWEWGCLSETNFLFEVASLSYTKIPEWVVEFLVKENKIYLERNGMGKGYYQLTEPLKLENKRKRILFEEPQEVGIEEPKVAEFVPRRTIFGKLTETGNKEVKRRIKF